MRLAALVICLAVLGLGCSDDAGDQQAAIDSVLAGEGLTTMPDSLLVIMAAYEEGRLTADNAARALVDLAKSSPSGLNVELPGPLKAAMVREMERRRQGS